MNQEEILRALEICTDDDGSECETCPLTDVPGCMYQLMREAKNLIFSERRTVKKGEGEPCKEATPWTRKRVLSEAEKCVCGQREQDYGTPEDSFEMIGKLWTVYLDCATKIDAHDVAAMMVLLKIARIAKSPDHMDSWCDLAGYASCGGEIAGKDAEQGGGI